jgi:DNA-binding GntR family transcriptional regulator
METTVNRRLGETRTPKTLEAYARLRDEIESGVLVPGQRLSEIDLVTRYGVSRTPVRDALVRLEQDGLVERQGSASYVRDWTADEVLDIYRVRVIIESAIAQDAAIRRTDTDLIRLQVALERWEAADPSASLGDLNTSFHTALATACHNHTLQSIQERLTRQVARFQSTLDFPGRWGEACVEHRQLVEAIQAQRADEAGAIARNHMQRACDIRLKIMAEQFAR